MNDVLTSRRGFLKASASISLAAGARAQDSGIIRVGVIGCGGRGQEAATNAMNAGKDVRIWALADIRLDRTQEARTALKQRYPDQAQITDDRLFAGFDAYRQVIAACDVVIIANAAKFHPLHLKTAVEAGRHVFLEKPHAIDPYGLRMLRAACETARSKGLSVVSGLQSRYHPGYQETLRRVHEGAIGKIVAIQETWLRPPYALRERRPGEPEILHQAANQYHFHWLSGDDVPQTLIHNLDRSRWALREANPLRCWGVGGRSTLNQEKHGNVFDHHSVVYEFPEGVRVYASCRTIDACYDENSSTILGARGRCDLLKLSIEGEVTWRAPGSTSKNPAYDLEHVALFDAIRKGAPRNDGAYMADSTQTVVMGQIACYTGQLVQWEQVSQSTYSYGPRPEECGPGMEPPLNPGPDGVYPVAFTPGVSRIL